MPAGTDFFTVEVLTWRGTRLTTVPVHASERVIFSMTVIQSSALRSGCLTVFRIQTPMLPPRSPNLNAFAERWVRSVKQEACPSSFFLAKPHCAGRWPISPSITIPNATTKGKEISCSSLLRLQDNQQHTGIPSAVANASAACSDTIPGLLDCLTGRDILQLVAECLVNVLHAGILPYISWRVNLSLLDSAD